MAIKVLQSKRAALRDMARWYNHRHMYDGRVSVRTLNMLRLCAKLTAAIVLLRNGGVA